MNASSKNSKLPTGKLPTGKSSCRASAAPDFAMVLAEPEIRLLMHADNVNENELLSLLKSVSVQLRSTEPADRRGPGYRIPHPDLRRYRRGVGVILINAKCDIFIARRADVADEAWQMPQGGIEARETPVQAAYRELKEEIGTNDAEIIAQSKGWYYYDVPDELAKKAWGGRWKGQRQKWFVMRFLGDDVEINLGIMRPEFSSWRWASVAEVEALAIAFKAELYVSLFSEFSSIFHYGRLPSDPPRTDGQVQP